MSFCPFFSNGFTPLLSKTQVSIYRNPSSLLSGRLIFLVVVVINRFYDKDRKRMCVEKYAHNWRDTLQRG